MMTNSVHGIALDEKSREKNVVFTIATYISYFHFFPR